MATTAAHYPPTSEFRDFKGMERLRLRAASMFEQVRPRAPPSYARSGGR
jgi:hypothetical protein